MTTPDNTGGVDLDEPIQEGDLVKIRGQVWSRVYTVGRVYLHGPVCVVRVKSDREIEERSIGSIRALERVSDILEHENIPCRWWQFWRWCK